MPTSDGLVTKEKRRSTWAFVTVTAISASRLVLAAAFVVCALDPSAHVQRISLLVFALLIISDFVDGPLARRWGVVSMFGFVVDGVGDRALYLASLLVMGERLEFPLVFVYLIVIRDVILYAARSIAPAWVNLHSRTRTLAKLNAGFLRVIVALYFAPFYLGLFAISGHASLSAGFLVVATLLYIALSYLGLFKILREYYLANHP